LRIKCHVHKLHTVTGRILDLAGVTASGIIALGLVLRAGGATDDFRACLKHKLASRCFISRNGSPPQPGSAASEHRSRVLDMCVGPADSTNNSSRQQRLKLQRLLNGDWRDCDNIEVYLAAGDLDLDTWSTKVAQALLPRVIDVLPRHRWCTSLAILNSICLLAACHDILRPALDRFLKTSKLSKYNPCPAGNEGLQVVVFEQHGASGSAHDTSELWREFNSRQAQKMREFVSVYTLTELMVMRMSIGPLTALLQKMLFFRSPEWSERPSVVPPPHPLPPKPH
jgi:hypothetical protein